MERTLEGWFFQFLAKRTFYKIATQKGITEFFMLSGMGHDYLRFMFFLAPFFSLQYDNRNGPKEINPGMVICWK